jgi:hypothetical protein
MRTENLGIRIQCRPPGVGWKLRVNTQDVVAYEACMDVYVQVRNFLECCLANRMPETQALIRKSTTNCTSDARHHGHERGTCSVVKVAHITEMLSRYDKRVAWVELPQINDSQCQVIFADDAGWCAALRNSTKNASVRHSIPRKYISRSHVPDAARQRRSQPPGPRPQLRRTCRADSTGPRLLLPPAIAASVRGWQT